MVAFFGGSGAQHRNTNRRRSLGNTVMELTTDRLASPHQNPTATGGPSAGPGPNWQKHKPVHALPSVTIRFAGDSGDGMQLAGTQFTDTSALIGNDISTLPDFPPKSAPPPARWPASRATRSAFPAPTF